MGRVLEIFQLKKYFFPLHSPPTFLSFFFFSPLSPPNFELVSTFSTVKNLLLRSLPDCSTLFIVFHFPTAPDLSSSPALRSSRSNRKRRPNWCPSLFWRSKKSAKKIRKSSRKQENRFNNNAFVKPKCRALDSTHRELSPINRVQTASGTRDEFGDKKEEEERERLEKSRRRGWSCKSSKGGFDLGGVVTTRK